MPAGNGKDNVHVFLFTKHQAVIRDILSLRIYKSWHFKKILIMMTITIIMSMHMGLYFSGILCDRFVHNDNNYNYYLNA